MNKRLNGVECDATSFYVSYVVYVIPTQNAPNERKEGQFPRRSCLCIGFTECRINKINVGM
jgi:hypothetical protein